MTRPVVVDTILVSIVASGLYMVATSRLGAMVRAVAFQALALAILPPLLRGSIADFHAMLIAGGTVILKVVVVPTLLFRSVRDAGVHREVGPLVGFSTSLLAAGVLVGASFVLAGRLPLPGPPISDLFVPVALSTVLIGLFVVVSRATAVTQVVGYLMLENGVFLFGLAVVGEEPLLVEMGILLDVFVAVFVMGIAIRHISRTFDHIDTRRMDTTPP